MTLSTKIKLPPKEIVGDLWKVYDKRTPNDVFIIPTNGSVNAHRCAIMGAGIAKEVQKRWPSIAEKLGDRLSQQGNVVHYFPDQQLIMFPTKRVWSEPSSIELIIQSCKQLNVKALLYSFSNIYVPRVGCGCGGLSWEKVRPILIKYLDDRYTIVSMRGAQ